MVAVQWWNSFIFAVFGTAILIGSRKYLWASLRQLLNLRPLQQYVAGLQTTLPIDLQRIT